MALSIYIEGRPAFVKKGSTFEYISENRLFTDADDYTLSITFPLRGCAENLAVFGPLNLHGHMASGDPFDMHISSGRLSVRGAGVVTGVSDEECKVQFLAGRSAANYRSPLADTYINDLDLGAPTAEECRPVMNSSLGGGTTVRRAWAGHGGGFNYVALPWVNGSTGNIHNNTRYEEGFEPSTGDEPGTGEVFTAFEAGDDATDYSPELSWFPYLIHIARLICGAVGYSHDFAAWQNSAHNHLLLCNAVPYTWGHDWNMLLPRWSVPEFFRNLEPLLEGEFDIDADAKRITFTPYESKLSSGYPVRLSEVSDSFSADVYGDSDECRYLPQRFMGYASADSGPGRAHACNWLVDYYSKFRAGIREFADAEALQTAALNGGFSKYSDGLHRNRQQLFHIADIDRHACRRVTTQRRLTFPEGLNVGVWRTVVVAEPTLINQFGAVNAPADCDSPDSPDFTIEAMPAVVENTDHRRMLLVKPGEMEYESQDPLYDEDNSQFNTPVYQTQAYWLLERGEKEGNTAYFSTLAVGYYPGAKQCHHPAAQGKGSEIFPITDIIDIDENWMPTHHDYTLALNRKFDALPRILKGEKSQFEFLADRLPDVRSVFLIRGKRYLCEKLTATFTEHGMSRKIKGTFWQINT